MIVWQAESAGPFVSLALIGRFDEADALQILPDLEAVIAREGSLSLLVDFADFAGWEWGLSYEQSAFGKAHWDKVARVAFVGADEWPSVTQAARTLFRPGELRVFAAAARDAASDWARGG